MGSGSKESLFDDGELQVQLSPNLKLRTEAREQLRIERRQRANERRDTVLSLLSRHPESCVAGLDEVGRGPLAGPVTAAAVVLDPTRPVHGLNDSKQLSAAVREALDPLIRSNALGWAVGWVWPDEIETLNIHYASLLAMRRAFATMLGTEDEPGTLPPSSRQRLLIAVSDGSHIPDLSGLPWNGEVYSLVKGDALCPAISAASIIAKVARDAWMCRYAESDPRYGFEQHMGYATPEHKAAIKLHGPCPIHRLSWLKGE